MPTSEQAMDIASSEQRAHTRRGPEGLPSLPVLAVPVEQLKQKLHGAHHAFSSFVGTLSRNR